MKILYMCEWTGRGIHPAFLQYAHGIQKAGACVYVATSGREYDPGTLQEASDYHLSIVELPEFFDRANKFKNAKRPLARWLSANAVDIIHCQGFRELYDVGQACRASGHKCPVVMTDRNSGGWTGIKAMKRIALVLRERPRIIALSKSHYERLRRIPWVGKRTSFIPNGVNTHLFQYAKRSRNPDHHVIRLIYPAYFTSWKGHGAFLEFCQELARGGRRFELLLPGYGPLGEDVRSKIRETELTDCVRIPGRIPWKELPKLFATCDIGVFPSLSEMMPKAVLEMMSTGLPVVAHDVGGISQVIEHGKTGFIVAVGDRKAFQLCLEELMDNANLRRAMGDAASNQMQEHFSVEVIGQQTVALYNRMCMTS